jgi:hexosaminidase
VFLHFGSKLDNNTIIHIWLDHATLAKVVAAGYRGILSNSDVWYLDHLTVPWQSFYANEPYEGITDPTQQALVLGGEVCMWGETVDTSDIFNTIWPRAAAAAERLWSPGDVTDTNAALLRLERFRCLLNQRGIDANGVMAVNGRDAPYGPGGCYVQ